MLALSSEAEGARKLGSRRFDHADTRTLSTATADTSVRSEIRQFNSLSYCFYFSYIRHSLRLSLSYSSLFFSVFLPILVIIIIIHLIFIIFPFHPIFFLLHRILLSFVLLPFLTRIFPS